jgi:membrane-associated protease RseP (regulator of RpoE activity)
MPFRLLFAAVISVIVHELFHLIALLLLGIPVFGVSFGIYGARIQTQEMLPKQELICALAGPVGGLVLVLLYRYCPVISICALVQTCYNFLPIYPTDGGRVLRCALQLLLKQDAHQWIVGVEWVTMMIVTLGCIYVTIVYPVGIIPICLPIFILLNIVKNK